MYTYIHKDLRKHLLMHLRTYMRSVQKVSRLKLHLPGEKCTMNDIQILFKIITFLFNTNFSKFFVSRTNFETLLII